MKIYVVGGAIRDQLLGLPVKDLDYVVVGATPEQASEEVSRLIVAAAKKLGVQINPKYGTWNPITASIESGDITDGAVTPAP